MMCSSEGCPNTALYLGRAEGISVCIVLCVECALVAQKHRWNVQRLEEARSGRRGIFA